MAYNAVRQRTVLFGGQTAQGSLSDTWEWNGQAWTLGATSGPAWGGQSEMSYDAARQRLVLLAGMETWEWGGQGWTLVAPVGPQGPADHVMAYDAARQRVVLNARLVTLLERALERGAALRRHEVAYPGSDGHEARDTGLRELVVGRQETGWRFPAGRLHSGAIRRLDHGP